MLIQAIAGGSAAVAVTGRLYWRRLHEIPPDPQARRRRVRWGVSSLRERGSFRDSGNQVLHGPDAVYRALDAEAAADWEAFAASPLAATRGSFRPSS